LCLPGKHQPENAHLSLGYSFFTMKLALIAPPFISVPPKKYGGTELFVAELAAGLQRKGIEVVLYTNGESTIDVPKRWLYEKENWPIYGETEASLIGLSHAAWAVKEASYEADLIHLNSAPGLVFSRFIETPFIYTIHHAFDQNLADYYAMFPDVSWAAISEYQRKKFSLTQARTIHHGITLSRYRFQSRKQPWLCFLGRIAPPKGTHIAIEIARKAGIPLKIGGEIQPVYRDYWENVIAPQIDGRFIEYVGEVGGEDKNELLSNALAMLFPVQWDEPFGLVMIESMACGTPVLAMPGGAVREVIQEGVSGHLRNTAEELALCAQNLKIAPETVRDYAEQHFSAERMVEDYIQLYSDACRKGPSVRERIVA
jgi:glycosyltransferase involved in cell wall biosynthesis